jgi:hypothetical protein
MIKDVIIHHREGQGDLDLHKGHLPREKKNTEIYLLSVTLRITNPS